MSENMKKCPYCGASLFEGDVFCGNCGKEIITKADVEATKTALIMCKNCGMQISADSKFCKYCGNVVNDELHTTQNSTNQQEEINKNLIHCPSCGKEVSQEAYQCPHCGHPFKEPKNNGEQTVVHTQSGLSFWGVVGAIIVAILICSLC